MGPWPKLGPMAAQRENAILAAIGRLLHNTTGEQEAMAALAAYRKLDPRNESWFRWSNIIGEIKDSGKFTLSELVRENAELRVDSKMKAMEIDKLKDQLAHLHDSHNRAMAEIQKFYDEKHGAVIIRKKITPKMLADIGTTLFGDRFGWQRKLADDLGVPERALRHWIAGSRPIPQDIKKKVADLIGEREKEIKTLINERT
jgi:hypothetical protein